MSNISRWVVSSCFLDDTFGLDPLEFDLTDNLQTILSNEVWKRKFSYGFKIGLQITDRRNIARASVAIYPRFVSGMVDLQRLQKIISERCGTIPAYLKLNNYSEWGNLLGLVVVEVEYLKDLNIIPQEADFQGIVRNWSVDFVSEYNHQIAVCKELANFILATLQLTFLTTSVARVTDRPINDGFFQTVSCGRMYCERIATDAFMHQVRIERGKATMTKANFDTMASIWHLDLWPLKRYLTGVGTDQLSMDHLLDLIYALEGLFDKNASSDFIKLSTITALNSTREEGVSMKKMLDLAYRIRNDMAHGNLSYDLFDKVNLAGKQILAQDVYWNMKIIVGRMLMKSIQKLIAHPAMRNLRFNEDDLLDLFFKERSE